MQVPLSWIKEYVEIDLPPDELAYRLTMSGVETTNLGSTVPDLPGVVTARIENIAPHPNADKLTVCQVRVSTADPPLTIVCGAPNIKEGDIVPLAREGTRMPDGLEIKRSKIRGVTSEGMMCSQRELKVSDDHSGIWILPPQTPVGKPLAEALGGDVLLEFDPTPNRGDMLCVLGIAREIAAVTGKKIRPPVVNLTEADSPITAFTRVDIEDYDGCPRYVARLLRGVKVGPSPEWMVKRLEAAGMRAISNVVDVTNYVLLELGQPLHAFDFNRLRQKRIVVKKARAGEKFVTLDGQEHELRDDTLMICDGEGPVAIAGVMGGLDSEVSAETRDVLIESAYFKPTCIRRTARLLGIPTEASRRFDKGVDRLGALFAADRAADLMQKLAGGEIARGAIDARREPLVKKTISLRPARTRLFLDLALSPEEQMQCLARLDEMEVSEKDGVILAAVPSYRPDLNLEIDLIEEIARLVGYDTVPATMPRFQMEPLKRPAALELGKRIRERLCALGFSEVILTSFEDPRRLAAFGLDDSDHRMKPVKLQNPLSENESILRTTLLPKLIANLVYNRSYGLAAPLRLFEINAVFENQAPELPQQRTMLAGLLSPELEKQLWSVSCPEDGFYDLKDSVEQVLAVINFPGAHIEPDPAPEPFLVPGKCARLMIGKSPAGKMGELHPETAQFFELKNRTFLFELNFDMLVKAAGHVPRARPVSRFPAGRRDIAVVVDESITMEDIVHTAFRMKSPLLEEITLFDVFRGGAVPPGKKSMAFHVLYQSRERTLTDEEVNAEHRRLAEELTKKLGAVLR